MGAYNEKIQWVKQCIDSILNQTYKNIEFIIVIDNPENIDLINYIEGRAKEDLRIVVIKNQENLGLVKSLNLAIKNSTGKYIARMDADDISCLNRIEKQISFMESHRDVDLLGTRINFIDSNGNIIAEDKYRPCSFKTIKKHLKSGNAFAHPTLMFKRDMIEKLEGYIDVTYAEDYYLVTRALICGYKLANINECLLNYRVREDGISQSNKEKQFIATEYVKKIYIENLKGKALNYSKDMLDELLKDKDVLENVREYIHVIEDFGKKPTIKSYCKIIRFSFRDISNFKLVVKKFLGIVNRKLTKDVS